MRILLVANYGPDRQKSMARYADFLATELRERGYSVDVIAPAALTSRFCSRNSFFFHWLGYVDKFLLFPPVLRVRARHVDIVHVCDHSNACYLSWTGKTPALITAHDALAIRSALGHFPQNPTRWSGRILQRWILRGLARARRIICVSEKTRQDLKSLLRFLSVTEVVPNVPARAFYPASAEQIAAVRDKYNLNPANPYLLHVGSGSWYKNRPAVYRIAARLRKLPGFENVRLVLTGSDLEASSNSQFESDTRVCVAPSDDDLRALYSGAEALLFPSLEEGFGWPIIEAQACGCPVITSDRPPMNAVAGGAAILIDPSDEVSAAAEIARRIHDVDVIRQAGFENIREYSVDAILPQYCRIYHEIAASNSQLASHLHI